VLISLSIKRFNFLIALLLEKQSATSLLDNFILLFRLKKLIIIHIPQMNNTSTYGIEQPNGSVLYNIFRESVFHNDILYKFRLGQTVQIYESPHIKAAQSIDDYFNESRFVNESSNVRGVLKLDGTIEYRYLGDTGVYVFKNTGHP